MLKDRKYCNTKGHSLFLEVYSSHNGFWWMKPAHPEFKKGRESIIHVKECPWASAPPIKWESTNGCYCHTKEIDPVAKLKHFDDVFGVRYGI